MNNEKTAREPHALDGTVILGGPKPWSQRVKQWRGAMEFEERISWLHTNAVGDGRCLEWIAFYLNLADRHGDDGYFLKLPKHEQTVFTRSTVESVAKLKNALSKKAFAILSERFFAAFLNEEGPKPCPYIVPYQEPLFSKLIWFLRPYDGYGGFDNLRPLHTQGLGKDGGKNYLANARNYAQRFCLDAWLMLNSRWREGWSEKPNANIAWPLRREIIALMRSYRLIDVIESDQYAPTLRVFKEIILSLCEEDDTPCTSEDLDSGLFVSEVIADLTRKSHPWARSIYVASIKLIIQDRPSSRRCSQVR